LIFTLEYSCAVPPKFILIVVAPDMGVKPLLVGPESTELLVRRSGAMCFPCCPIVVRFCVQFFSLDFSSDTDSLKTESTWYNPFGGAAWTPSQECPFFP
jgi:hypothetical protein